MVLNSYENPSWGYRLKYNSFPSFDSTENISGRLVPVVITLNRNYSPYQEVYRSEVYYFYVQNIYRPPFVTIENSGGNN